MANKKIHGERNKDLSIQLFNESVYLDWSITTAFYSVIHFVEDKILPCNVRDKHCVNINEVKEAYKIAGRHSSRERLVQEKLPIDVATKYKWLDDKSRYARYTTFKISKGEAEKAKNYLEAIHKCCYDKASS
jgi:hypothetical protein